MLYDIREVSFYPMKLSDFHGYFTLRKLNPDTIPEGFHCYELSEHETVDSKPLTHEPFVGTFITNEDISEVTLTGAVGNITSTERHSFYEIMVAMGTPLDMTGNMLC